MSTGEKLQAGLDTLGIEPHSGKFLRQPFLFHFAEGMIAPPHPLSIWFDHPWARHPTGGPAVRRIEMYRVKRMPAVPDLAGLLPPPAQQRHVGGHSQSFDPYLFRDYQPVLGFDYAYCCQGWGMLIDTRMTGAPIQTAYWPGPLQSWRTVLSRSYQAGVTMKTYLAGPLSFGAQTPEDECFTNYDVYNLETIPLHPRADEYAHLAELLHRSLPLLVQYPGYKQVVTCNICPDHCFQLRNLFDFNRETGAHVPLTLDWQKAATAINSDPVLREKWSGWACRNRHAFDLWLRDEVRKYRRDLVVVLNANAYMDSNIDCLWNMPKHPDWLKPLDATGTIVDACRLCGLDPELYRREAGFALAVYGTGRSMDLWGTPTEATWDDPAYVKMRACFSEGVYAYDQYNWNEGPPGVQEWSCAFYKSEPLYRRGMLEAALANVRSLEVGSFGVPWKGRMEEFREFAVPWRLLPFVAPTAFEGQVSDPSGKVVVRAYGKRVGVFNPSDQAAVVTLVMPPGTRVCYDLSSGVAERAGGDTGTGKVRVALTLGPWSMKTLEPRATD
jgi:hypothetical protein